MSDKLELLRVWSRIWGNSGNLLLKKAIEQDIYELWRTARRHFLQSQRSFIVNAINAVDEELRTQITTGFENKWGYIFKTREDVMQATLSGALIAVLGSALVWDYDDTFPLAAARILYQRGYVPSFDGKMWRLHDRRNGEVKEVIDASACAL
jgi:hypothetical protein